MKISEAIKPTQLDKLKEKWSHVDKALLSLLLVFVFTILAFVAQAQSTITYKQSFQLINGAALDGNTSVAGASDILFNPDGTKLYAMGTTTITQYTVTTAFDILSGLSSEGTYDFSAQETSGTGIAFSVDGSKIFIIGYANDAIHQYSLSVPFDITSTVTYANSPFSISGQDGVPYDISFSADGMKMHVMGANGQDINQYSLTTPFDITAGVTFDGSPFKYSEQVSNQRTYTFGADGYKLFILGMTHDRIFQYSLTNAFDVTSGVSYDDISYYVGAENGTPTALTFSADGSVLFMGGSGPELNQYNLSVGGLTEGSLNNGTFTNTLAVQLAGGLFTNTGGTLTSGADFSISNLPVGLIPSIAVSENGAFGVISFSGNATNHQNVNDVASLQFTFQNSAFVGNDASAVTNAVGASSGISIDFNDNHPELIYDFSYEFNADIELETSLLISTQENSPQGLRFSSDGLKLFIIGAGGREVNQYSLQKAYDVSIGLFDGLFSVTSQESTPQDLIFSSDGMKMFVVGNSRRVYQYSLTTAFDITSGVTYDDVLLAVSGEELSPTGLAFSDNGMKLFIVGRSGDEVNQYSLTNAYDISTGVTHDGSPFSVAGEISDPYGMTFNGDGTKMLICGFNDKIYQYELSNPFDVTSGVSYTGVVMADNIGRFPTALVWNSDGTKLFVVETDADRVYQYNLPVSGFAENQDNMGYLDGEMKIRLIDDSFINAGGTLLESTHFTIPNKPSGLTASMLVDANGLNATLSFTGTANSHQAVNTVNSLTVNFLNTAFEESNAADVTNAVNHSTDISVEFDDNNKSISYGSAFELFDAQHNGQGFISGDNYSSMTFNNDGSRIFITTGFDRVYQLITGTPYDISSGISFGDNLLLTEETRLTGLEFSHDGMKMFVIGTTSNAVNQYDLGAAFDITTASFVAAFDVSNEETAPRALAFNSSGTKMFVGGSDSDKIHQYTLSTSFDVQSGVSNDGSPLNIRFEEDVIYDIEFGDNGSRLYITGTLSDAVHMYNLGSAYDVTTGVSLSESFDVSAQQSQPTGLFLTPSGNRLILFGANGAEFDQYDLSAGGFNELPANNGEVTGELVLYITDETFTNGGSTMAYTTHYTMANVPNGLTPNLAVDADGTKATLTFSGTADDHQDLDDVSSLGFNFTNAAFAGGSAAEVNNASSAESGIGIDFSENFSTISYGYSYSIANGAELGSFFDVASDDASPQGVYFNSTGTKMYVVGLANGLLLQYALSTPYEIGSGVLLEGSFDISLYDSFPTDITFNPAGNKMFVLGQDQNQVYQFSLSTPFDLTAGVTHDNSPAAIPSRANGIRFSPDGSTLFVYAGISSSVRVNQYALTTPYDITAGINFVSSYNPGSIEPNPRGIEFSKNGFTMLLVGLNDIVHTYSLSKPFDVRDGVSAAETFNLSPNVDYTSGLAFDSEGTRLFFSSSRSATHRITEYNIDLGGFTEIPTNDGQVEGDMTLRIFDATFTNAGGTLTPSTDYTITGVSPGLTPNLAVAADGLSAVLTLSGSATAHQSSNNVSDLTFTFENSAFVNDDASLIDNADGASSNLGIAYYDNNPALIYGDIFDITGDVAYSGYSYDVGGDPMDMVFSQDGTKMFIVDFNDIVKQYTLSSPFDLSGTVTPDAPTFSLMADEVTTGIAFSTDGMTMYAIANTNLVHQYSLTNPFDITSGVTNDGSPLSISGQENSPADLFFSPDGTKLYTVGSGSDEVNQYSLSTPFDITSGVSFDGSPHSILAEDGNSSGIALSQDGRKMFVVGYNNDNVNQYSLAIPFDITKGVSFDGSAFSIVDEENQASGMAFSPRGDRFFVVGRNNDEVYQYNLGVGGFDEVALNHGEVEGTTTIYVYDDQFTNAGSTLTLSTDYAISNLPAGLSPTLTVDADGRSAILTLSGSVANHQAEHSVGELAFVFENSAFDVYDASEVENSNTTASNVAVRFRDNSPMLTYGDYYDLESAVYDENYVVTDEDDIPTNLTFSEDGYTMFLAGRRNDAIYQYSLTVPYDVTTGVSFEGSLDISTETRDAMDLKFSSDGLTLLVLSDNISSNFGSVIAQYSLTNAFNIISGATYSGFSEDISNLSKRPHGFAFSADGNTMFVADGTDDYIRWYALGAPFDLSGGITYVDRVQYAVEGWMSDIDFNRDGSKLYVLNSSADDAVEVFDLPAPFVLSDELTPEYSFSVESETPVTAGFAFGNGGSNLFVVDGAGRDISQFTMADDGFEESGANDGTVNGSLVIHITDDFFNNPGGSLSSPTDYSITNLPAGLMPGLAISGDGTSAMLSFTGAASSHMDNEDISNLIFDFNNSAFLNYDAADVENAQDAESYTGINFLASQETDILTFTLAEETGAATINTTEHTVAIEVVFGTDVSDLTPTFTISESATVSPMLGTAQDFSSAVTYTVTAEDPMVTQDWETTVTVAPNTENDIVGFTFVQISGEATIDDGAHTVTALAVAGTDVSGLTPTISLSQNATISPLSGSEQNFTSEVTYTVSAENGDEQVWEVVITEELAAPTDILLSDISIDENGSVNDVVGTLSSTDASFMNSHTYMLVSGTGDNDNALFDVVGVELQVLGVFDHEDKDTYNIRLQTNDGNGGLFEKAFIISINDVNEAPTGLDITNRTIDESNPVGTVVGILSTEDVDQGDIHTYTVADGCTVCRTNESSYFTIVGNELRSSIVFDFETTSSYGIDVTTTDAGGNTWTDGYLITINDIQASVTAISLDASVIDENQPIGSLVGNLSTSGEDLSGSFTYVLVSGAGSDNNTSFNISGSELSTTESFNYEVKNNYSIRVQTDDGAGHTLEQEITITINDVSESTDTHVLSFVLAEQTSPAVIDDINNTIAIEVSRGTDLTALNPTITVSDGATISPNGVRDFSSTVTYTITAEEPTISEEWSVTVTEVPNNETDILSFALTEQTGAAIIDANAHTISIEVAAATDLSSLAPDITVSDGATISPTGALDFTSTVTYVVTAEDAVTTQSWAVTITSIEVLSVSRPDVQVSVFPNPASFWFSLDGISGLTRLQLINAQGRIVLEQQLMATEKIDIAHVQSGMYLLLLVQDDITTTTKVLIRR